ncbi:phage antirepressor N-terminal domain-containing protein [Xenorhabdus griffiniae]|uniref:phage antirepressor N-terminal domain-containing protein n=1 Tax=Xenorhabdus griffiniae TaxID=351672 RepID=UPI0030CD1405
MLSIPVNEVCKTINVPFYGADLYVVNYNGEPYVPMKPIVDGMGLAWQTQHRKLTERFAKGIIEMVIPTKGGSQSMICLALRKLAGWLATISPNKVKASIREKVIRYQDECDDVLYEYWTTGEVKAKSRKQPKQIAGRITADQQEAIKQLVLNRGKALPKENQAKAMITMWSALKSHFGCTYKEIESEQFTEALSLAARVPLEGEYLGKQEPSLDTNVLPDNGKVLVVIRDRKIQDYQTVDPNSHVLTLNTFMELAQRAGYLIIHKESFSKIVNQW